MLLSRVTSRKTKKESKNETYHVHLVIYLSLTCLNTLSLVNNVLYANLIA